MLKHRGLPSNASMPAGLEPPEAMECAQASTRLFPVSAFETDS